LRITETLLEKISYLCSKVSTKEWSGPLFFKIEGDILSENDVTITADDLYLMDIGTGATTEYNYADKDDERLISLYSEKPELMDYRMGSVHSHNNLGAFFSTTDITELKDGSKISDMYLMLVVNNKPYTEWVAKIGIIAKVKKKVNAEYTFYSGEVIVNEYEKEEDAFFEYDLTIETDVKHSKAIEEIDKQLMKVEELEKKKTKYPVQRDIWENSNYNWKDKWNNYGKPKKDKISLSYIEIRNILNATDKFYTSFSETIEKSIEEIKNFMNLNDDEAFEVYINEIESNLIDEIDDFNVSKMEKYIESVIDQIKPYGYNNKYIQKVTELLKERVNYYIYEEWEM